MPEPVKMRTVRHLGRGAFGQVRLCITAEEEYVAVKLVDLSGLSKVHRKRALKEAKLLQKLSKHQNIVECKDVLFSEKDVLQIVLEFAPCGDLHQHCERHGRCPEPKALCWGGQILAALAYCHVKKILHRDLKPANILLFPHGKAKLADFGVCFVGGETGRTSASGGRGGASRVPENGRGAPTYTSKSTVRAKTVIGTPHYFAPELVNGEEYGPASDIWSFGVCLYESIAFPARPFSGNNLAALALKISKAEWQPLPADLCTPELEHVRALLETRLLLENPKARIKAYRCVAEIERIFRDVYGIAMSAKSTPKGMDVVLPGAESVPVVSRGALGIADSVSAATNRRAPHLPPRLPQQGFDATLVDDDSIALVKIPSEVDHNGSGAICDGPSSQSTWEDMNPHENAGSKRASPAGGGVSAKYQFLELGMYGQFCDWLEMDSSKQDSGSDEDSWNDAEEVAEGQGHYNLDEDCTLEVPAPGTPGSPNRASPHRKNRDRAQAKVDVSRSKEQMTPETGRRGENWRGIEQRVPTGIPEEETMPGDHEDERLLPEHVQEFLHLSQATMEIRANRSTPESPWRDYTIGTEKIEIPGLDIAERLANTAGGREGAQAGATSPEIEEGVSAGSFNGFGTEKIPLPPASDLGDTLTYSISPDPTAGSTVALEQMNPQQCASWFQKEGKEVQQNFDASFSTAQLGVPATNPPVPMEVPVQTSEFTFAADLEPQVAPQPYPQAQDFYPSEILRGSEQCGGSSSSKSVKSVDSTGSRFDVVSEIPPAARASGSANSDMQEHNAATVGLSWRTYNSGSRCRTPVTPPVTPPLMAPVAPPLGAAPVQIPAHHLRRLSDASGSSRESRRNSGARAVAELPELILPGRRKTPPTPRLSARFSHSGTPRLVGASGSTPRLAIPSARQITPRGAAALVAAGTGAQQTKSNSLAAVPSLKVDSSVGVAKTSSEPGMGGPYDPGDPMGFGNPVLDASVDRMNAAPAPGRIPSARRKLRRDQLGAQSAVNILDVKQHTSAMPRPGFNAGGSQGGDSYLRKHLARRKQVATNSFGSSSSVSLSSKQHFSSAAAAVNSSRVAASSENTKTAPPPAQNKLKTKSSRRVISAPGAECGGGTGGEATSKAGPPEDESGASGGGTRCSSSGSTSSARSSRSRIVYRDKMIPSSGLGNRIQEHARESFSEASSRSSTLVEPCNTKCAPGQGRSKRSAAAGSGAKDTDSSSRYESRTNEKVYGSRNFSSEPSQIAATTAVSTDTAAAPKSARRNSGFVNRLRQKSVENPHAPLQQHHAPLPSEKSLFLNSGRLDKSKKAKNILFHDGKDFYRLVEAPPRECQPTSDAGSPDLQDRDNAGLGGHYAHSAVQNEHFQIRIRDDVVTPAAAGRVDSGGGSFPSNLQDDSAVRQSVDFNFSSIFPGGTLVDDQADSRVGLGGDSPTPDDEDTAQVRRAAWGGDQAQLNASLRYRAQSAGESECTPSIEICTDDALQAAQAENNVRASGATRVTPHFFNPEAVASREDRPLPLCVAIGEDDDPAPRPPVMSSGELYTTAQSNSSSLGTRRQRVNSSLLESLLSDEAEGDQLDGCLADDAGVQLVFERNSPAAASCIVRKTPKGGAALDASLSRKMPGPNVGLDGQGKVACAEGCANIDSYQHEMGDKVYSSSSRGGQARRSQQKRLANPPTTTSKTHRAVRVLTTTPREQSDYSDDFESEPGTDEEPLLSDEEDDTLRETDETTCFCQDETAEDANTTTGLIADHGRGDDIDDDDDDDDERTSHALHRHQLEDDDEVQDSNLVKVDLRPKVNLRLNAPGQCAVFCVQTNVKNPLQNQDGHIFALTSLDADDSCEDYS
ncbi:unnamed protein product [Amoebophrya sp. A25]|nr:unnamed protein product [Amoebophrya sp. A25]|eukprot:GSA25T00001716001.1